ncbi:hypothetical protein [Pseudomonas veronii]|uniref:hypothetical protein n=1 Tax=Pseudomonas veronii TaxID=76761 RepID=UPI0021C16F56|nr:hypothetical protein [Pseudomonas veronii]MCT9824813.1 hypothetical protein [Pseudomonas veronii]
MSGIETPDALKARKLAELRIDLARALAEKQPDLRIWRQGLIHGRLLELESSGVLSSDDSDAFSREVQATMDAAE